MYGGAQSKQFPLWVKAALATAVVSLTAIPAFSPYIQAQSIAQPTQAAASCTIATAGDIAKPQNNSEATAKLVESVAPDQVLALGDQAYDSGTASEYENYYDPTWGRFKEITKATPGNHEYYEDGAPGYFGYFGFEPYYSFDICGWHMVSLNSEIDTGEQVEWLEQDLAAAGNKPLLMFWHTPRFSSSKHGSDDAMQPFWEAAANAGAKIVLTGHDHVWERFAPMDASGQAVEQGTQHFVIGTGGAPNYELGDAVENSEVRINNEIGIGVFDLRADGYDFQFMTSSGTIGDEGSVSFAPAATTPGAQAPGTGQPATGVPQLPVAPPNTAIPSAPAPGQGLPAAGTGQSPTTDVAPTTTAAPAPTTTMAPPTTTTTTAPPTTTTTTAAPTTTTTTTQAPSPPTTHEIYSVIDLSDAGAQPTAQAPEQPPPQAPIDEGDTATDPAVTDEGTTGHSGHSDSDAAEPGSQAAEPLDNAVASPGFPRQELPRTGSDSWVLIFVGSLFVALGLGCRQLAEHLATRRLYV